MTRQEFDLAPTVISKILNDAYEAENSKIHSFSVGKCKIWSVVFDEYVESIEVNVRIGEVGQCNYFSMSIKSSSTKDEAEKRFRFFRDELAEIGVEI